MLYVFKQASNSSSNPNSEKKYGKYPQMDTTYDSREYHKLVVFFCHYFRDDLTEFTQGLLFSVFHGSVAFLLS